MPTHYTYIHHLIYPNNGKLVIFATAMDQATSALHKFMASLCAAQGI